MQLLKGWAVGIIVLLLSACHTIEHRSEDIAKAPLPILVAKHQQVKPKLVWSSAKNYGVGKSHAKLQLAITEAAITVADYKGNIVGFEPHDGTLKIHQATKMPITAGPVIAHHRIFLGTDDGQVLAYQEDGRLLWRANVNNTVLAKPVVNNDMVFVHTLNDNVMALNAQTGQLIWHYTTSTPALMLRQSSSPVLMKNHLIVGFSNGLLKSLDPLDGSVEWERELAVSKGRSDLQRMIDISADPVVKGNLVYVVGYQGKLAAVEAETGSLLWERELSSYSGLAVSNQKVFVPDVNGTLWAVDRKTGEVLWKHAYLAGRRLSSPELVQNYVVVGDDDGYLHWISQQDGSLVGRTLIDKRGVEAISVAKNNMVYVLGKSGKVAAYTIAVSSRDGA